MNNLHTAIAVAGVASTGQTSAAAARTGVRRLLTTTTTSTTTTGKKNSIWRAAAAGSGPTLKHLQQVRHQSTTRPKAAAAAPTAARAASRVATAAEDNQWATGPLVSVGIGDGNDFKEQKREQEETTVESIMMLEHNNELTELAQVHRFKNRHIGPNESEIQSMVEVLGYGSLSELIDSTVPKGIRLNRELRLPEGLSEDELIEQLRTIGRENDGASEWRSFIGMGYYECITPAAILRNMFENPGWTTAYTAYQSEIAQGRLESLMNYQTLISDLTKMDVANASLLDEATAAAEAMQVCLRQQKSKQKQSKFLVSSRCHPQIKAVVETRAKGLGLGITYFDELELAQDERQAEKLHERFDLSQHCGLLVQYPNTDGHLFDLGALTKVCHKHQCLVVTATDLLACTLFKPPGEFDEPADMAIGSSQRFGVPLNFGGPHAAFLACRSNLVRSIPGRIVGLTKDAQGNQAYRFALQTREQHIRRDKATSNICTAQVLLANMSAMYAVYHGPDGLREIARRVHLQTSLLAQLIGQFSMKGNNNGLVQEIENNSSYFDTLTMRVTDQSLVKERARGAKINLRYDNDRPDRVSISLDESTKLADVFRLAALFVPKKDQMDNVFSGKFNHNNSNNNNKSDCVQEEVDDASKLMGSTSTFTTTTSGQQTRQRWKPPLISSLAHLKRQSSYLTHPVFNSYHSEAKLIRYMKQLENKDISLVHSMIPLGSCTMKLNPTSQMLASSWQEFARLHPYQPLDQCKGYLKLFEDLNEYLCEITGYDKISFQPNSGAQGEYAGLRAIRSYLDSIGEQKRNICLIPVSAHGTNPASAKIAGYDIQQIGVLDNGNIDVDDLRAKLDKAGDRFACLMLTYPSTFGVFEENIKHMCDMAHQSGGQVYLDGANMNAQVGLCRPGDYGGDVSHLNLHKTFCIPHGGGGPGAGPIGVKSHLIPFLPEHPLWSSLSLSAADQQASSGTNNGRGEQINLSFGSVSASAWGSPAILPISWAYIRAMGKDLKRSSEIAILNANYMCKRLQGHYKILFRGERGNVGHEFVIDCRPFKKSANIEAADVAKRLQDFGLHAPTVSFPIANTLMIEPTESEDKRQLDQYCEALLKIHSEIRDIESGRLDREDNPIKNAPHTQQVVCASEWNRSYSREVAAFPAEFVTPENKIWPTVGRVDDIFGDTNLFCSCAP